MQINPSELSPESFRVISDWSPSLHIHLIQSTVHPEAAAMFLYLYAHPHNPFIQTPQWLPTASVHSLTSSAESIDHWSSFLGCFSSISFHFEIPNIKSFLCFFVPAGSSPQNALLLTIKWIHSKESSQKEKHHLVTKSSLNTEEPRYSQAQ